MRPTAYLPELFARVVEANAMQAQFLERAVSEICPSELDDLERYVAHCVGSGVPVAELAASYDLIVRDMVREQIYFRKHGRYRHATFADVASSVYMNPAYMGRYMHGLALTSFLWPNHASMRRFFLAELAAAGARSGHQSYLEVGPGHGFYFMAALRSGVFTECHGIDVSPTSVALTRTLLESDAFVGSTPPPHYTVEERDFNDAALVGPYDMVVMGEVLEHVERPLHFLERARELCRPGGRVFVTTCINSPALDHIYLFRSEDEVRGLVADARMTVEAAIVLPYPGTTPETSARERLPVNVAMTLSHRAS